MNTNSKILVQLFILLCFFDIYAQHTVSGVVSSEGQTLSGAVVKIKNSNIGVYTDVEGKYQIQALPSDTLAFSFIGLETVYKKVQNHKHINAELSTSKANIFDEVIVVGYKKANKTTYTGSAKTVKYVDIKQKSVTNISQSLYGEIAGVSVVNDSGQPGTASAIRIRGYSSVNGNSTPLYVLDGSPFLGNLNSINPTDIKEITILKDATATSIYGAKGANGVIIITTKSGQQGKNKIEFNSSIGVNFNNLPNYPTITSPEEYIEKSWEALKNNGDYNAIDNVLYANEKLFSNIGINEFYNIWTVKGKDLIDPKTGKMNPDAKRKYTPENWRKHIFKPALRTSYNLTASDGMNKINYYTSLAYLKDEGTSINSSYQRYSTRLNLGYKPKKWIDAKINIGYVIDETINNAQFGQTNLFMFANKIPPIYPLYLRDHNGKKLKDVIYGGFQYDYGKNYRSFFGGVNPVAQAIYDLERSKRKAFNLNSKLKLNISNDVSFLLRYNITSQNTIGDNIHNPFYGDYASVGGALKKYTRTPFDQNFLKMLNVNKTYGNHNIKFLIAHENNHYQNQLSEIVMTKAVNLEHGIDVINNYINSQSKPSGAIIEQKMESYFSNLDYSFKNKYYLTLSVRRDGSSKFYHNKWGDFGSVGLAWILSRENFIQNLNFINFLKLKTSYGKMGIQKSNTAYGGQGGYNISADADKNIVLTLKGTVNPDITWETSKMFQIGIEFNLFNNVVSGSVDFYNKITDNLLFERTLPPSSSNYTIDVNDGILLNRGLEFELTTHILKKQNYGLNFNINAESISNKLLRMPFDPSTNKQQVLSQVGYIYGRSKDRSILDFYMPQWAGVDPKDGFGMWYMNYDDKNNNNTYDNGEEIRSLTHHLSKNTNHQNIKQTTTKSYYKATHKYINKSAIPLLRGGLRLNAYYKNFSLSTQLTYSIGAYGYDQTYADLMLNTQVGMTSWHTDIRKSWKKLGDKTDVPRLFSNYYDTSEGISSINFSNPSSRFLISSDYLALNNIKLDYTFDPYNIKKIGLSECTISISADNLYILTARKGFNPAMSQVSNSSPTAYTPFSSLTLGVHLVF